MVLLVVLVCFFICRICFILLSIRRRCLASRLGFRGTLVNGYRSLKIVREKGR